MTQASTNASPGHDSYAAFGSRDFRLFFFMRLINALGTNIMMPTLGWQIYALTRDPVALGLIGLAVFVPVMLSTLPSGQAADRLERKRLHQFWQWVLAAAAAYFSLLTLAGVTAPAAFYAGAALCGGAKTFSMPAATAGMPHLVSRAHYPNAVAWTSSTFQTANVIGPALAGLMLYAFGEAWAYALAGVCYVGSFILATLIRTRSQGADTGQRSLAHLFSGLSYVFRNRLIFGATTLDLFALLLGGATAMLPVYAHEVLHVGEAGFGLLRAAPALGAATTAMVLAHSPLQSRVGYWLFGSIFIYGISIMAFGLSTALPLSLAALVVLGSAEMLGAFVRQTLVQLSAEDDMRGRVTSVNMLFVSTRNELGDVQSGFAAALIGVVPAVVLGGAGTILIAALWARLFPALRDADRFEDVTPVQDFSLPIPSSPRTTVEA
jgi:MFS family permease